MRRARGRRPDERLPTVRPLGESLGLTRARARAPPAPGPGPGPASLPPGQRPLQNRVQPGPRRNVPKACPQSPPSRVAQNASATAAGACRTSRDACSVSAIRSTSRRAVTCDPSASWSLSPATAASSRASAPRVSDSSSNSACAVAGSRPSARSTSRALTLPEPSQMESSGASR